MKNKKFTVVIVDENLTYIKKISQSLSLFPVICIVGSTQNASRGKELILNLQPDLLFIDASFEDQSGFELLNSLEERLTWPMQIIIYAAYEKYLLEALRASAFDFLIKPYEEEEFQTVMNRFFKHATKVHTQSTLRDELLQIIPSKRSFLIATVTGYQMIQQDHIGYFEYMPNRRQWSVLLFDQSRLHLKRNTSADDILKYAPTFNRISHHQIINLNYLSAIEGKDCKLLHPFHHETSLFISRFYLKELQEKLETI